MIYKKIKKTSKKILNSFGYEVSNIKIPLTSKNLRNRPVGNMLNLLEELKFRGLKCGAILDVGANRTIWSRMAKKVFDGAKFFLIEPQIEMESYLKQFTLDFENSKYFLNGAGSKEEALPLTIWDDLAGSSFLPRPDESLIDSGKQRNINMITIDDLIETEQIEIPDLIKLDIQGFELEALKGASKTFGKTEVYILEVSLIPFDIDMPVFLDVINFMAEKDYVVYDFAGFLRRPLDGALGQCDICFVKKNGYLRKSKKWA